MNNSEYVNGFSCAIKEDQSEVVLVVYKKFPKINEDGEFDGVENTIVNTLIMTSETAKNLNLALTELLYNKEHDE